MPEPHLRAADADRTAVAAQLGDQMSAGRLTVAEYDERLARAYAAKTYGELAELTADLPFISRPRTPAPRTAAPPAPSAPSAAGSRHGQWGWSDGHDWRAWAGTSLIVLVIWAATSLANWEFLYFWPIWVIGPWGAVLLAQTFGRGRSDDHRRRRLT